MHTVVTLEAKNKNSDMASSSKGIRYSILVLRIFTPLFLAGSVAVMVTNNYTLSGGVKTTFKDVITYRYVLSTSVIGAAYALSQLPLAIYYACTDKRMIRNACLLDFVFYADMIITFLLATGVGAGFAVSFEFKKFLNDFFITLAALNIDGVDDAKSKTDKFLDMAIIATTLLGVGFICMAILSIFSSINRTTTKGGYFFG